MKPLESLHEILSLIDRPAFFVQEGALLLENDAAKAWMLPLGSPVLPLISQGQGDYLRFTDGCLSLMLTIGPREVLTTVRKLSGGDLFVLSTPEDSDVLRGLALAAQQLRGPLNEMLFTSERLTPLLSRQELPEARQGIASMNRSLHQMMRLICNMSDAQQDGGLPMELLDIPAVMGEIFDSAAALCAQLGVRLRFQNLPRELFSLADSTRLERAVYNLISNALKFSPRGTQIEAALTRSGSRLTLTVRNAIDPELGSCGDLFSRFLREPALEDSRNGLGLGLHIIQQTAALHGGTVLLRRTEQGEMLVSFGMAIRQDSGSLHAPVRRVDYAGERSHALVELSELLPEELYLFPEHPL